MLETPQKISPTDKVTEDYTRGQSAGNAAWLAGFIDGEGCIGFNKIRGKKYYHVPHLCISNTHQPTIERIAEILSSLGVPYWIQSPGRGTRELKHPTNKQAWQVVVRGMRRLKPLLEIITDHLFTKRRQAEVILDFINYRLSVPVKTPYGEREFSTFSLLHELNRRGSSETTRVPPVTG